MKSWTCTSICIDTECFSYVNQLQDGPMKFEHEAFGKYLKRSTLKKNENSFQHFEFKYFESPMKKYHEITFMMKIYVIIILSIIPILPCFFLFWKYWNILIEYEIFVSLQIIQLLKLMTTEKWKSKE